MTFSYMPYWRATEAKVEGSSQRIQEDCMNFAKIVESIGLQVVKAIMTLIAFIPILVGSFFQCNCSFFRQCFRFISLGSFDFKSWRYFISWLVGIKLTWFRI